MSLLGLMTAMVSWAFLMARSGLPLTLLILLFPTSARIAPMTSKTPATMRKASHGASPAATRPYAAAIISRISARNARTPAAANRPAPTPALLASAPISALASAISPRMMDEMSWVASATSWPRVRSGTSF